MTATLDRPSSRPEHTGGTPSESHGDLPRFDHEALRRAREETGLNQRQAARLLNVSPQRLGQWENGTHRPDVRYLRLICDRFAVGLDDLVH